MKRLLAYLFLVLGLGLVVNKSVKADKVAILGGEKNHLYIMYFDKHFRKGNRHRSQMFAFWGKKKIDFSNETASGTCQASGLSKCTWFQKKNYFEIKYKKGFLGDIEIQGTIKGINVTGKIKYRKTDTTFSGNLREYTTRNREDAHYPGVKYVNNGENTKFWKNKQTQIAKAEPSQTQEVVKKGDLEGTCIKGNCINGQGTKTYPYERIYVGEFKGGEKHGQGTETYKDGSKYVGEWKDGYQHGQGTYTNKYGGKYVGEFKNDLWHGQGTWTNRGYKYVGGYKDSTYHGQGTKTWPDGSIDNGIWKNGELVERNNIKTQIAKIEPSQTQEVVKKEGCIEGNCINGYGTFVDTNGDKYIGEWKNGSWHGQGTYTESDGDKYIGEWKHGLRDGQGTSTDISGYKYVGGFKLNYYHGQGTRSWSDGRVENGIFKLGELVERNNIKTQIAKAEPTIIPEDKPVEVVETTQEIFKPEDKDIDKDPPLIEIAEAITVDSQTYTIKGIVKDKSKPIYLEINGRPIEVKNSKFELERFNIDPDVVEELKIVAIDQWNNRSEKIVKVTVELKDTQMVKSYEELKPNRVKVLEDKNKIAIIIGIEKYKNTTECNYCNRDAKAFKAYATRALGVIPSNVISLVDSRATRGEILRAFKISLPIIAGDGEKDINIFFAGHGLASDDGNDLYILPQDGDSSLLEDTAISRVDIVKLVQKVNPKSVTMFFDTCYSGQTRDERMLVASLRPIRIVADEQDTPDNFTIFTASNYDQTSGSIEEAKHGMFSYYLMKGLEGKADEDKDKKITNGELIAYLKTNVSKEAFTQNREQDPMLSGDPDQVLMRYR